MSNTTSTECPECGLLAIRGAQEAGEHETETCECPNSHTWERRLRSDLDIASADDVKEAFLHDSTDEDKEI